MQGSLSNTSRAIEGTLAITDRRVFLVGGARALPQQQGPNFDAIYDPNYAKQQIELARAKNEAIKQRLQYMSILSRSRETFKMARTSERKVDILTAVQLQKGLTGENLLLNVYHVFIGSEMQRSAKIGGATVKLASLGLSNAMNMNVHQTKYELRIKQPLSILAITAMLGSGLTAFWFTPIIRHCAEKAEIRDEPLLELMQTKA
jgi:hypothetical protein